MKVKDLIAQVDEQIRAALATRATQRSAIDTVRAACEAESNRALTAEETTSVDAARAAITAVDAELDQHQARRTELEAEQRADDAADALAQRVTPGAPRPNERTQEQRTEINERRTYSKESDPKGIQFARDVAASFMGGSPMSGERLSTHMREEVSLRDQAGKPLVDRESGEVQRAPQDDRAVGTGAFSGLVVPQYLVDEFAPFARAGRPFADAMRHHDLPATGMTVSIGRLTTPTQTGLQSSENTAVTEQDADDTLLTVPVQTNAGQQTVSRQGSDRGLNIEDTIMEDLFGAYGTGLDSIVINQAVTGLTAVASAVTYTDASPTAAELYPKFLQAPANVESNLLNMAQGDVLCTSHSRRWYWLQSQLTATWPMFGQPQVPAQLGGVNYGAKYGDGVRGILPNGTPVITDNNVATNFGAGTNEDEIYFSAQSESHLWEDTSAPILIRAEQTKAASLGILLVVYGYFAYTFSRRPHAQKISGTGLVTPAFV